MTVKDPNVLPLENEGPSDATPKTDAQTALQSDERLDLPNVPEQHEVDPTIETAVSVDAPYGLNKDGTPAKKRGRKPAVQDGGAVESPSQFDRLDSVTPAHPVSRAKVAGKGAQPVIPSPESIATDYKAMGELAATLWFNVGETMLGADWAPTPPEVPAIAGAFRNYFQSKEIKVLDPTLVLLIALGGYTVARVNKPTVQSRFGGFFQWIKSKAKR